MKELREKVRLTTEKLNSLSGVKDRLSGLETEIKSLMKRNKVSLCVHIYFS